MISSIQNTQIKKITNLSKTKERKKTGLFIVEGLKMVNEIPNDWEIETIVVSNSFINSNIDLVNKYKKKENILEVEDSIFKKISEVNTPQGILAVVKQRQLYFKELLKINNPCFLIIEDLQDPGNLGTIIRTADAALVNGIVLSKNTVDLYNPKVVRATMGSIFHLPIIKNVNLSEVIYELKQKNIQVLAAHLKGAKSPYSFDLTKGTALIIGNEGSGLSDEIANEADHYVKIPILGKAESLNAAMAAGILIYEVVRQRFIN